MKTKYTEYMRTQYMQTFISAGIKNKASNEDWTTNQEINAYSNDWESIKKTLEYPIKNLQ